MISPFLFLAVGVAMAAVYRAPAGLAPPGAAPTLALVALGLAAGAALARLIAASASRRLGREPALREGAVRAYRRGRVVYGLAALAAYGALVHGAHWTLFVDRGLGLLDLAPLNRPVHLAPLLALAVAAWCIFHRIEAAWTPSGEGLGRHLGRQLRAALIPLVPFLAFQALGDLPGTLPALDRLLRAAPLLEPLAVAAFLVLVFTLAPVLVRHLWPGGPLPAGPLRTRLEAAAERAGVRLRDIHLWDTGGSGLTNACVAGLFPGLRRVFLTDALVRGLAPEEVEAVFAHELGHAVHRHFLTYLLLALGFLSAMDWLEGLLPADASDAMVAGASVLVALAFLALFGALSRRLEQQADLYALRFLGTAAPLAGALRRLTAGGTDGPRRWAWRHPSVPRRLAFLGLAEREPAAAERLERQVRACVVAVGLLVGLGVAGLPARHRTTPAASQGVVPSGGASVGSD
ncbi:MAG: M48 family metalloprotease [Planctomycetes bacterium]|nr:M48 family metalloprotease [Planctomycetota bacterium]